MRQWFQRKHKQQCITVVQMCKFGKSMWSFSASSHLFPVSLPRYLLTASSQPVHFDRWAELDSLASCQGLCSRAFILWGQWAHLWDGDQSSCSITLPWASEDLARMAHGETAKTYTPARIMFQSPVVGCLLFLFPKGKEGSIRPWKTDPICRSGNEIHFFNSATQWLLENASQFRLQE